MQKRYNRELKQETRRAGLSEQEVAHKADKLDALKDERGASTPASIQRHVDREHGKTPVSNTLVPDYDSGTAEKAVKIIALAMMQNATQGSRKT